MLKTTTILSLSLFVLLIASTPHWALQTSGVTSRLRGMSAVNERIAWASGSRSTVLRTNDAGATWQPVKVTDEILDFRDIDALDTNIVYVLSIGNGPASRIYKSTDAGRTWSEQFRATDSKVFLDAMSFWDADHGIVIGDSIDLVPCILTTTDGGKKWSRVAASALPVALENEGAFAASGSNIALYGDRHAWIGTGAGSKARVFYTTDRGRSWKVSDTPLVAGKSSGIFSVAFRDSLHGVVVGGDYSREDEAVDNMAFTSDGGATWKLVKGLSGFRSAVAYVPGETSTIVAVGPLGTDYSTDGGVNWRVLTGPGFDAISFGRGKRVAWGSGARGAIGRLTLSD